MDPLPVLPGHVPSDNPALANSAGPPGGADGSLNQSGNQSPSLDEDGEAGGDAEGMRINPILK